MVIQMVFNERHEVTGDGHRTPTSRRLRRPEGHPTVSQLDRRLFDLNRLVENVHPMPSQSGQLTESERAVGRQ